MTDTVQALTQQLDKLRSLHASGALGDAQYAASRAPLERRLVDLVLDAPQPATTARAPVEAPAEVAATVRPGWGLWAALGGFAILVAAAGYWWTGAPDQIGRPPPGFGAQAGGDDASAAGSAASAPHALNNEQFAAMTTRLAARLKDQPDDAAGWSMLGRSYMALGRNDDALAAFERAVKLKPTDATTVVDFADALAVKNGNDLDGEPTKLIEHALKLEPDNLKALALAGTAAFNHGDYAKAAQFWERAVKVGPPDSPIVQQARNAAAEARERGKLPPAEDNAPPAAAAAGDKAPGAVVAAGSISGTVTLAPALKGKAAADDTVFIFARAVQGSRMPLALVRKQVKDLPFTFQLDDSQAMSPATRLSTAGSVIVGARVSKSGQAMPQPGDLEGLTGATAVGSTGVAVVIASEVK